MTKSVKAITSATGGGGGTSNQSFILEISKQENPAFVGFSLWRISARLNKQKQYTARLKLHSHMLFPGGIYTRAESGRVYLRKSPEPPGEEQTAPAELNDSENDGYSEGKD